MCIRDRSLATLGTLGAFLTPVLLSTGQDSRVAFYLYLIVVNLGILAIAYYKRWRLQEAIAFTATTILSYVWIWDHFHETCLLYTSDAADERSSVDLGGRRI